MHDVFWVFFFFEDSEVTQAKKRNWLLQRHSGLHDASLEDLWWTKGNVHKKNRGLSFVQFGNVSVSPNWMPSDGMSSAKHATDFICLSISTENKRKQSGQLDQSRGRISVASDRGRYTRPEKVAIRSLGQTPDYERSQAGQGPSKSFKLRIRAFKMDDRPGILDSYFHINILFL